MELLQDERFLQSPSGWNPAVMKGWPAAAIKIVIPEKAGTYRVTQEESCKIAQRGKMGPGFRRDDDLIMIFQKLKGSPDVGIR